jgi:hypothetical protein
MDTTSYLFGQQKNDMAKMTPAQTDFFRTEIVALQNSFFAVGCVPTWGWVAGKNVSHVFRDHAIPETCTKWKNVDITHNRMGLLYTNNTLQ